MTQLDHFVSTHDLTPAFAVPLQGNNTALHWAAMRGHVEVVRALLAAGADKAAVNNQDATPMDLCQPLWSLSWRFTREVLAAGVRA